MNRTRRLPRRRPGVDLLSVGNRFSLVDSSGHELCALNDTASALWDLCDGQTSIDEMVGAVCLACAIDAERASSDIKGALEQLTLVGALDWEDS